MKIAVTSTGNNIDSTIDPRFGRCAWFIIVDTDDMNYESFINENAELENGAGIRSVEFVASKGVTDVLTGKCGPKASQAFSATNIKVHTDYSGPVNKAVEQFKKGNVRSAQISDNPSNDFTANNQTGGAGRGMGMGGRCMGGSGRGMGMGGGRGRGIGKRP